MASSKAPIDILQTSSLWDILNPQQRMFLSHNYRVRNYKRNHIIYKEKDQPKGLLCVAKGFVKIYKEGVGNRCQIVRIVRAGEFFGYRALFAAEPYVTTAASFSPCSIYEISEAVIRQLIRENADLAFAFLRFLSVDLGVSDARSVVLTQKHLRGRLAETLLYLKQGFGTLDDGKTLLLHPTREEIAGMSNMTTSNAIRTLSAFIKEGLVEVNKRTVRLIDEKRLREIQDKN